MSDAYTELTDRARRRALLGSASALLGWDQETMMPPKASAWRADELAHLARLAHEAATDPRVGELIATCEADASLTADPVIAANLREMRRDHDRLRALPSDLVAEINRTSSLALEAWKRARADADFAAFRPWLERQLELARRKADCHGVPAGGTSYDALLEDYAPGTTCADLDTLFAPLRRALVPLLKAIAESAHVPDETPARVGLPIDRQRAFCERVIAAVGYDLEAGRLDVSTHPFSTGIGPGDTRITSRFQESMFLDGLGSTLHEAGHAMYEQGLPRDACPGQPLADDMGLGIHESQSRTWENHVGRSRAFWRWVRPLLDDAFGSAFAGVDAESLFRAANVVRPHPIRVESDEATYNLHIMLRYDLERALLAGDLTTADLPAAWNDRIRDDLGLEVACDAEGCLQDIHWAMGAIGYFPSYSLGNLYAAQFWEALERDRPDLDERLSRGEFEVVLDWQRETIHRHGRRFTADELCRRISGEPLGHRALVEYLAAKFGAIYGLGRAGAAAD